MVAIHDAARPLAGPELYARVLAAATERGGAIPVAPLDRLVDRDGSRLARRLVGVQTPQAFRAADLLAAHRAAGGRLRGHRHRRLPGAPTRDLPVAAVRVDAGNLKITVADDFAGRGGPHARR